MIFNIIPRNWHYDILSASTSLVLHKVLEKPSAQDGDIRQLFAVT